MNKYEVYPLCFHKGLEVYSCILPKMFSLLPDDEAAKIIAILFLSKIGDISLFFSFGEIVQILMFKTLILCQFLDYKFFVTLLFQIYQSLLVCRMF